jgi:hypothetical protein
MKHHKLDNTRRFILEMLIGGVPMFAFSEARAAVTEPNGQVVPDVAQASNPTYTEATLQTYFDGVGENVDAVTAASKEPGKFSPLCNFDAELVLSVSGAKAGIAWYNVDEADPTAPPASSELHHILLPSNTASTSIKSADIRNDPDYRGGYIGFALTKDFDNSETTPPDAIYYSEYQRNYLCTGCSPEGHWIAALAYRSTQRSDTYYLAFEDWEGARGDASSWQNDGDFNDKVFKLVGISCAGGGLECNTGALGLCGKGVTECATDGGAPTCTSLYQPRAEQCDAIDNDCNGEIDDGELCPTDQVCRNGSCVFRCGGGEFLCPSPLACGSDDYCIDSACVNMKCDAGLACRNGVCTSPCTGVVCPLGQTCTDGVCKDLCAGKVCGPDSVCQDGACIGTCGCTACAGGKACDTTSGYCVDPGCEGKECPTGTGCVRGECVDACAHAICPGGAACSDGSCAAPPISAGGASSAGGTASVNPIPTPGSGTSVNGGVGGTGAAGGTGSGKAGSLDGSDSGCGCRITSRRRSGTGMLLALCALAVARGHFRRRRLSSERT